MPLPRHGIETMSENNFFKQILNYLKVGRPTPTPAPAPRLAPNGAAWSKFLHMVENSDDIEIPCDKVFALLDRFAELEVWGEEAARLLPLVKKHLDRCWDCCEEYAGLLKIIEAAVEPGG